LLAILTCRRGAMYRDPEELWRDAAAKVPTNPRAYYNLGVVIHDRTPSRAAESEGILRQAIAVDSTYLPAWTSLAAIMVEQNRVTEARSLLEHALAINPNYAVANERLGDLLLKQGEPAKAIPFLERVVAQFPTDELLGNLASAYMATGRRNDAINALRRAVELNPARADAAAYAGGQLLDQGRPDQAVPYLELGARAPGASALTFALLSTAYAALGRGSDAVSAARAAEQRAAGDEDVYVNLGRAMLIARRLPDADRYFTEAVRLNPADPEALTRLGMVKAAAGSAGDAVQLFRRALQAKPNYPPAVHALAQLRGSPGR
jgi:tetratricopeptide (TPR) repeat protein